MFMNIWNYLLHPFKTTIMGFFGFSIKISYLRNRQIFFYPCKSFYLISNKFGSGSVQVLWFQFGFGFGSAEPKNLGSVYH